MVLLEGKELKQKILNQVKQEVEKSNKKPCLIIIQVGSDSASNIYVKQKEKMANYVGFNYQHLKYNDNITEIELIKKIEELNNDNSVHGILVQLPLPKSLNEDKIINTIKYYKDVDGLTDINAGKLIHNKECLIPCTPLGIMELLKENKINVSGKNVVVVGRSLLVGRPLAILLTNNNATVTLCHSKTDHLEEITKKADILVVAIGKPNYITKEMVKENAIVIDVGINRVNDKICGDVDINNVKDKVSYITPVPGGVGQMTVASLSKNTLKAYYMEVDENVNK